jgi:hypothetical protein
MLVDSMLTMKPKPVKPIFYDKIDYEIIKKQKEQRLKLLEQQLNYIKNIYYPY